jgi:hypothetical protein
MSFVDSGRLNYRRLDIRQVFSRALKLNRNRNRGCPGEV